MSTVKELAIRMRVAFEEGCSLPVVYEIGAEMLLRMAEDHIKMAQDARDLMQRLEGVLKDMEEFKR